MTMRSVVRQRANRFVVLVGIMSLFADFTYEGSRSIVGQYLGLLGASALAISVVSGSGELLGYGLRLISGPAADRSRRYWPIIISGYVVQMSVVPLLALAHDWPIAALLVLLERVGKATRNPPRDAMLAHAASEIGFGRAFGIHEALDQMGATLGPLAVAMIWVLGHHNYRLAFGLLAIPAAVMLALLGAARWTYPRPSELERSKTGELSSSVLPRSLWVYLIGAAFIGAGFADFPLIAYHWERSHVLSTSLIPVLYAVAMSMGGIGSLVFGHILDRAGPRILVPLTVVTAAYAPLVFLGSTWGAIIGALLWGLGSGIQESAMPAVVARIVGPERRSSALVLFTGVYGIAWFLGSVVIGLLFDVGLLAVVLFAIASEALALPFIARSMAKES